MKVLIGIHFSFVYESDEMLFATIAFRDTNVKKPSGMQKVGYNLLFR
jgi:hypothetical protein